MTKSLRGRGNPAPPFFGSANEHPFKDEREASNSASRLQKVAHGRAKRNRNLQDAIINGERVLIVDPAPTKVSERNAEIRTRVALSAAGVLVMKHTVEACHKCRARPTARTGLGKGATDLLCIVAPMGRVLFIEMKKPGYSPSDVRPDQHCFMAVVRRFGGISGIATSPEEALALLELARRVP
jgi:hypothetical protein